MEHEMKISPSTVRRLRTRRGWSQDQLARASGLSLRTIQRVEAEGIVSMDTAVNLAATFEVRLLELQAEPESPADGKATSGHGALFPGLAIITVAVLAEGMRPHVFPLSTLFMTINILVALVGALVAVPALVRLVRQRQYIGTALAMLGTPLITLLAFGVVFACVSGHAPTWQLTGMGMAGVALGIMAVRELNRARHAVRA